MRPSSRARRPLEVGEVHLWWAFLDLPARRLEASASSLAADEWGRARGIASARARRRWIASRAALRAILAEYVGARADEIAFRRDARGRPALSGLGGAARPRPRFSLSRSGDLVLVAVGRGPPLGADVEQVRPLAAIGPLARRALPPDEQAAVGARAAPDRPRTLLTCWVRKEAYLKALGVGLGHGPERGPRVPGPRWLVRGWEPEPGYVAAVAVRDRAARLLARRWEARP